MNLTHILFGLISGAVGGNIAGAVLKQYSLGPIGNTALGILGGGAGWKILNLIVGGAGAGIAADIVASVIGGALLMAVVGLIKQAIAQPSR